MWVQSWTPAYNIAHVGIDYSIYYVRIICCGAAASAGVVGGMGGRPTNTAAFLVFGSRMWCVVVFVLRTAVVAL